MYAENATEDTVVRVLLMKLRMLIAMMMQS